MGMSHAQDGSRWLLSRSGDEHGTHGLTFGPVPSRRFGRSLGINSVPAKLCTYSCVYCQVGRTDHLRCVPRALYGAAAIATAVRAHLVAAEAVRATPDYLTFVPDGEPTLDAELGAAIRLLRPLGIPIAVITNGSLLSRPEVRAAVSEADQVSIKVDAVRPATWRKVNRPHRRLELETVLAGIRAFRSEFGGTLTTETMLIDGLNDGEDELRATAAFVGDVDPAVAYVTVPTRPPAEAWAIPPPTAVLARAYEVFRAWHARVELLLGYEGEAFASTGDAVTDLLSITAVHPMREGAVHRFLDRAGASQDVLDGLLADGRLLAVRYGPHRYYLRRARSAGCES